MPTTEISSGTTKPRLLIWCRAPEVTPSLMQITAVEGSARFIHNVYFKCEPYISKS